VALAQINFGQVTWPRRKAASTEGEAQIGRSDIHRSKADLAMFESFESGSNVTVKSP
jgi:hypothetical protein